jgi:molybdopterin synthase catalytic subunit
MQLIYCVVEECVYMSISDEFRGWIAPVGTLELGTLIDQISGNDQQGAITTFTGVVREISDVSDKKVVAMEVESWEGKGSISMNAIAREIGDKYGLLGIRIIHLEGRIKLGMPIVYIVIYSIHRKEAFEALEDAINAYKQRSPVWKKEIYDDGSGSWISTAKTGK